MTPLFVDTSFYIAIVNPSDVAHAAAVTLARSRAGATVTSEYVLLELANFLSRADDKPVFLELLSRLRADPSITIVPVDSTLLEHSLELFRGRLDKDWSLTDCCSFVIMKEYKIDEALTADHHFDQAGFRALLT